MAAPEQPEETRILDEALGTHSGQIDMLMQAVRGELTVGTLRYSIFEERPHISMIEVLEDYRRQGSPLKCSVICKDSIPMKKSSGAI